MSAYYRCKFRNTENEKIETNVPCYSSIYYINFKDKLEYLHVYCKKIPEYDPNSYQYVNSDPFRAISEKEVDIYVKLLRRIGLSLELVNRDSKLGVWENLWEFKIDLENNSNSQVRLLLNALRYLYEGNGSYIVEWFTKIGSVRNSATNLMNKFIICHYTNRGFHNTNHWFLPWNNCANTITEEKFKKFKNCRTPLNQFFVDTKTKNRDTLVKFREKIRLEENKKLIKNSKELIKLYNNECKLQDIQA